MSLSRVETWLRVSNTVEIKQTYGSQRILGIFRSFYMLSVMEFQAHPALLFRHYYLPRTLEKTKEVGVLRMEPKVGRQALQPWVTPLLRYLAPPNTLWITFISYNFLKWLEYWIKSYFTFMKVTFYVLQGSPVFEHHILKDPLTRPWVLTISQTVALQRPYMLKPSSSHISEIRVIAETTEILFAGIHVCWQFIALSFSFPPSVPCLLPIPTPIFAILVLEQMVMTMGVQWQPWLGNHH